MSPPISITTSMVLTFLLLLSPSSAKLPQCGDCTGQAKLFYSTGCPTRRGYEKKTWGDQEGFGTVSGCSKIAKGVPLSIYKTTAAHRCSVLVYSDEECSDDRQIAASSVSEVGCKNIEPGGRSWQVVCVEKKPFC